MCQVPSGSSPPWFTIILHRDHISLAPVSGRRDDSEWDVGRRSSVDASPPKITKKAHYKLPVVLPTPFL